MSNLQKLEVFSVVAETLSFTKAAKRLGLTRSMISQHIKSLETELDSKLFLRTTRSVSLTESGQILSKSTKSAFENLDLALSEIQKLQSIPQGKIKISCPVDVGITRIAKLTSQFSQIYSSVQITLDLDDGIVDLAQENYDIGVRVGWLDDSSHFGTVISHFEQLLCASKDYLKAHGTPTKPEDLSLHKMIHLTALNSPDRLIFKCKNGQSIKTRTVPSFLTNSPSGLEAIVKNNAGIGIFTSFQAKKGIEEGTLVKVLGQYELSKGGVYAVSPHGRNQPFRISSLIKYLKQNWESA